MDETVSQCPCGKGKIVADVDSPDNAWSRTTRERRIDCGACAKQWVLRFERELVDRAASEASSAAWNRIYAIDQALEPLARQAIDEIFKAAPRPTFKDEHQLLDQRTPSELRLACADRCARFREGQIGVTSGATKERHGCHFNRDQFATSLSGARHHPHLKALRNSKLFRAPS